MLPCVVERPMNRQRCFKAELVVETYALGKKKSNLYEKQNMSPYAGLFASIQNVTAHIHGLFAMAHWFFINFNVCKFPHFGF